MNRQPGESDDRTTRGLGTALLCALGLLVVYLLPFVTIMIDEFVLGTNWFSRHLPDSVGDVMRTIYPFHKYFH
jgi:hypothetical protein